MHIRLEMDDGTTNDVRIIPVDLVAFERHWKMSWEAVSEAPKVEHTLWMAWKAAHRAGLTGEDFDAWAAHVVDFPDEPEGEGGDPLLQPNRSSRRSQSKRAATPKGS